MPLTAELNHWWRWGSITRAIVQTRTTDRSGRTRLNTSFTSPMNPLLNWFLLAGMKLEMLCVCHVLPRSPPISCDAQQNQNDESVIMQSLQKNGSVIAQINSAAAFLMILILFCFMQARKLSGSWSQKSVNDKDDQIKTSLSMHLCLTA